MDVLNKEQRRKNMQAIVKTANQKEPGVTIEDYRNSPIWRSNIIRKSGIEKP